MVQHSDIDHAGVTGVPSLTAPNPTTIELGHASDTTLARASAGNVTIEGNAIYRAGGTDVPLADGGTGASLTDPNADRIMFWDDSAGAVTWLTAGTNLTITATTIDAAGGSATFCGAKVYNNAAQSVASGSEVTLTFNTEEYDTDTIHDTGSNTSRMTIPTGKDGKWRFRASVTIAANATGTRAVGFRKNAGAGTYVRGGYKSWLSASGIVIQQDIEASVTGLVATDYIEVFVFQNSGGNLNVGSGNDWEMSSFEAEFLGA